MEVTANRDICLYEALLIKEWTFSCLKGLSCLSSLLLSCLWPYLFPPLLPIYYLKTSFRRFVVFICVLHQTVLQIYCVKIKWELKFWTTRSFHFLFMSPWEINTKFWSVDQMILLNVPDYIFHALFVKWKYLLNVCVPFSLFIWTEIRILRKMEILNNHLTASVHIPRNYYSFYWI